MQEISLKSISSVKIKGDYIDSVIYNKLLYLVDAENKVSKVSLKKIFELMKKNDRLQIKSSYKLAGPLNIVESTSQYYSKYLSEETRQDYVFSIEELNAKPLSYLAPNTNKKMDRYQMINLEIFENTMYLFDGDTIYSADLKSKNQPQALITKGGFDFAVNKNGIVVASGENGCWVYDTHIAKDIIIQNIEHEGQSVESISSSSGFFTNSLYTSPNIIAFDENRGIGFRNVEDETNKVFEVEQYIYFRDTQSVYVIDKVNNTLHTIYLEEGNKKASKNVSTVDYFHGWKGKIISAQKMQSLLLVELEHALFIKNIHTDSFVNIPIDDLIWRVFPKSDYYGNQVHLISDDYMEILFL